MWMTPSGVERKSVVERMADMLERPDDFRLLERVPLDAGSVPLVLGERSEEDTILTILDTETTSTDARRASIIELAMLRCRYGRDGRLVEISDVFDKFEDPGMPIPGEVTEITGITDDMVRGQRLNTDVIRGWLGEDPLIVAHNAGFDRPIFERRFPAMARYRWACSYRGIPWNSMGYVSASLPLLLEQEGWFFDAHRAHADCLAVSWMLHVVPGALARLVESTADHILVSAGGKTFNIKDHLKKRGYGFNSTKKEWEIVVPPTSLKQELAFLNGLSYRGVLASHTRVTARDAFK